MLLRLVPKKTDFRFLRFRLLSLNGSGVLMVASLVLFFLAGLNYGIDFRGGILIQTSVEEAVPIDAYRDVVGALGLGDNSIQEFGTPEDVLIVIEAQSATGGEREVELAQQAALTEARNALAEAFPGIEFERTEVVGPKVSGELVRASTIAVIGAVIGIGLSKSMRTISRSTLISILAGWIMTPAIAGVLSYAVAALAW